MIPASDPVVAGDLVAWLWAGAAASFAAAAIVALSRLSARLAPIVATVGGILATAFGGALVVTGTTFSVSAGQVLGMAPIDLRYDGLSGVFLVAFGLSVDGGVPVDRRLAGADSPRRVCLPPLPGQHVLVLGAPPTRSPSCWPGS